MKIPMKSDEEKAKSEEMSKRAKGAKSLELRAKEYWNIKKLKYGNMEKCGDVFVTYPVGTHR